LSFISLWFIYYFDFSWSPSLIRPHLHWYDFGNDLRLRAWIGLRFIIILVAIYWEFHFAMEVILVLFTVFWLSMWCDWGEWSYWLRIYYFWLWLLTLISFLYLMGYWFLQLLALLVFCHNGALFRHLRSCAGCFLNCNN
jgi:hypothetical protein